MNIQMTAIGLAQLQAAWLAAPELTTRALLAEMTAITVHLQGEVQDAMPAVSGLTRASIAQDAFSTPTGVLGVVGSPAPAALFVELGTKPHMPPVSALIGWVQERLGVSAQDAKRVAFLIARKIARKGTDPQRIFAKTLDANEAFIARQFDGMAARLAQHLQGGVAV